MTSSSPTLEELQARRARFYEMARDRHSVAQFRTFPEQPQGEAEGPKITGYRRNFSYSYETMADGSIVQTATELPPTIITGKAVT